MMGSLPAYAGWPAGGVLSAGYGAASGAISAGYGAANGVVSADRGTASGAISADGSATFSIVNGSVTIPTDHPGLVQISSSAHLADNHGVCGGAVLDKRHVLTAAHCFTTPYTSIEPSPVGTAHALTLADEGVFSVSTDIDGQHIVAGQVYIHPGFIRQADVLGKVSPGIGLSTKLDQTQYDVAIIETTRDLPWPIMPIAKADQPLPVSGQAVVAGWGATTYNPASTNYEHDLLPVLRQATVPIQELYVCQAEGHALICAEHSSKDADVEFPASCFGDSGGPLVQEIGGVRTQIGIVSNSPNLPGYPTHRTCGHIPTLYASVSYLRPWIDAVVAGSPGGAEVPVVEVPQPVAPAWPAKVTKVRQGDVTMWQTELPIYGGFGSDISVWLSQLADGKAPGIPGLPEGEASQQPGGLADQSASKPDSEGANPEGDTPGGANPAGVKPGHEGDTPGGANPAGAKPGREGDTPAGITPGPSAAQAILAAKLAALQPRDRAHIAFVASEDTFADALASSGLQHAGPVLLNDETNLEPEVLAELIRRATTTVYLLGGTKALAPQLITQLADHGIATIRVSGKTREETALEIAHLNQVLSQRATLGDIYVARAYPSTAPATHVASQATSGSGTPAGTAPATQAGTAPAAQAATAPATQVSDPSQAFADSITLGPLAAMTARSVLLTPTASIGRALDTAMREGVPTATLIGGGAALSPTLAHTLAEQNREATVTRIAGPNRFATAGAIGTALAQAKAKALYTKPAMQDPGPTGAKAASQTQPSAMPDPLPSTVIVIDTEAPTAWQAGFASARLGALQHAPILLVAGSRVPEDTQATLQAWRADKPGRTLICMAQAGTCQAALEAWQ